MVSSFSKNWVLIPQGIIYQRKERTIERQNTFGWLVAIAIFSVGVGAGLFLVSFILTVLNRMVPVATVGGLVAPVLAFVGTMFLVVDLGSRAKAYRLVSNPRSWMSRGTLILSVFIVSGLSYSLPGWDAFAWLPWSKATTLGLVIGLVAVFFSVMAIVYTGFLLGAVKRIPFWNSPILPVLFLFASLSTGIAALELMAAFSSAALGPENANALRQIGIVEIVVITLELFVIASYLETASRGSLASAHSVRLLKNPLFIIGVITLGLLIPLVVLLVSAFSMVLLSPVISSILVLAGSLFLRYSIIRAGTYMPLRSM